MSKHQIAITFLVLFILPLMFACGPGPGKDKVPPATQASRGLNAESVTETVTRIANTSAESVNGRKVYSVSCLLCHGKNGDQKANNAMDLTTSTLSLEERIKVIAFGRKQMTSFQDKLRDPEIKAVAEYVATLRKDVQ